MGWNHEQRLAYAREYRSKNRSLLCEKHKEYYQRNRCAILARKRGYALPYISAKSRMQDMAAVIMKLMAENEKLGGKFSTGNTAGQSSQEPRKEVHFPGDT